MSRVPGFKIHVTVREPSTFTLKSPELKTMIESALANHPVLAKLSYVRVTVYKGAVKE